MGFKFFAAAAVAFGVSALPAIGHAASLSGTVNFSGSVAFTTSATDFSPAGGGTGTVTGAASTGDFTAVNTSPGTIKDLTTASQPIGTPFDLTSFLVFTNEPDVTFDLTSILGGVEGSAQCAVTPAALGQVCTPSGTQFNLQNSGSNLATLSFEVAGIVHNGASGDSTFTGFFTTQFNESYQTFLATLAAEGTFTTTYSATLTVVPEVSTAPEPTTWALAILGFAGLGFATRRRVARA